MDNPKVVLTFRLDTYDLDIDAPDLSLDFVMSIIERAKRMLEVQEKIMVAHQISQGVRAIAANEEHTKRVLSKVKLQ
jgi:hypothetical protein